jgi:hypothetical protein
MKRNPSMNESDTRSVPERFQGARDLNAHRLQPRRHFCEDLARQWRFRIFLAFSLRYRVRQLRTGTPPKRDDDAQAGGSERGA